ncbi:MAG: hypothetical protein GX918_10625 [Clostridiales bacterium]|nr:hypothetical protein [Clostridiales bacterium]
MITTMNYSLQEKAQESLRDWDLEKLYHSTVFFLEDCKRNGWINEEGNYELLIDVISEGWMGVHQVDEILDAFNLWDYVEDEEWKWEVIDDFTMKLGELITQVMQDKYGLQGVYYFSSLDTGEFGLIYSEEA